MYEKYLLRGHRFVDSQTGWIDEDHYFDTEDKMIKYVKDQGDFYFKVKAVFEMKKLNNDIFL